MKLKDFRKNMKKNLFNSTEAQLIAFQNNPKLINLQLHQWKKSGDILQLKRGLYAFSDSKFNIVEIAKALYSPCYFSLEYVLSFYGIIPEAVFAYTLITTKTTRIFRTAFGHFYYHSIKPQAFTGFDTETLIADKEKALVDYFYLKMHQFKTEEEFWRELRLEATRTIVNFKKVFQYAKLFNSVKLYKFLKHFQNYAKSHQISFAVKESK